ncbi:hypothetical protein JOF29_007486 [Kribbella aluminosa]|uniref:Uncharacterized protein n=1 Tax=Kribbella aluminosa TaxID=416017 RepID=A0ABS4UXM0_9ACTN|nr:hypothetical protein [Kribbella aluminosa]
MQLALQGLLPRLLGFGLPAGQVEQAGVRPAGLADQE